MIYIKEFLEEIVFIIGEMAPYLLLGFLFAGILYILFPKKKVKKYLGRGKRGAVVNASLLGIPLPLCSCGVIPTGISFYRNGASKGSTVSFLISTPQTGVDSILVTYSMLGLPFALIRPVIALITGISGGFLTNRFSRKETETGEQVNGNNKDLPAGIIPKVREMLRYAFVEFLQDISTWLIAGVLIAAAISVVIPDDFFTGVTNSNLLEMVVILIAAIPVYICATASVPIAAVLILKGISPGAALVLLMAGPATNAATIMMIGRVLGRTSLFTYLFSIITGAMLFGLIINNLLPAGWFEIPHMSMTGGHDNHLLPEWLRYGSAILLGLLLINGYIQKYLAGGTGESALEKSDNMKNLKVIKVEGMTCSHCKANVENAARSVEGIETVNADITSGEVTITGNHFDPDKLRSNIESLGYKVKR
ncbi:MAG TPA: permease [Bacteroidales bacterium]|nr:permease [Bacteroidales bacterium]